MTKQIIEQAVNVIRYAIENGISVSEASVKKGFSPTYVKNVKLRAIEAFHGDSISIDDYNHFMKNYSLYEGSKKKNNENKGIPIEIEIPKVATNQIKVEKKGDEMEVDFQGDKTAFESFGHMGYPDGHIKTLDGLLEKCDVDQTEWEVLDYLVNKWDVTSWKQGFPQTWENFQVKAKLKKIAGFAEAVDVKEAIQEVISEYKKNYGKSQTYKVEHHHENNLLEISLFDLHIGKLAWAGETGENFDVKIATNRFLSALNTLLKRAQGFTYNRILFPIGNDFFNVDNLHNTTTAGTPQQEDLRWQKTFKLGCNLLIKSIDLLKEQGVPVDVVVIPGNHDFERSFYLGTVLEAWYNNDSQVKIDNGASPRKYYEFGKVLLGLTHGKYEAEGSLPLLMATEYKEAWGRTIFHEWHVGHIHRKKNVNYTLLDKKSSLKEDLGVTVRYLSSLTGTEQWHHKRGFVGSQKAGEAFIWNDESGIIGQLNTNFVDFDKEN
jgi:hypothetical protein